MSLHCQFKAVAEYHVWCACRYQMESIQVLTVWLRSQVHISRLSLKGWKASQLCGSQGVCICQSLNPWMSSHTQICHRSVVHCSMHSIRIIQTVILVIRVLLKKVMFDRQLCPDCDVVGMYSWNPRSSFWHYSPPNCQLIQNSTPSFDDQSKTLHIQEKQIARTAWQKIRNSGCSKNHCRERPFVHLPFFMVVQHTTQHVVHNSWCRTWFAQVSLSGGHYCGGGISELSLDRTGAGCS